MTKERQVHSTEEALKLALEALETCYSSETSMYRNFDKEKTDNAITAIKAALAQPEQRSNEHLEPVAWWMPKHKAPDMVSKVRWSDDCEPLYPATFQKKPLTDEEIKS